MLRITEIASKEILASNRLLEKAENDYLYILKYNNSFNQLN